MEQKKGVLNLYTAWLRIRAEREAAEEDRQFGIGKKELQHLMGRLNGILAALG